MPRWIYAAVVFLFSVAAVTAQSKTAPSAFSEDDALRILDHLSQSLESNNQDGFLKAFDPGQMPSWNEFREQIASFFTAYQEFVTHYHLRQVSMDGDHAVVLADFELQVRAAQGQPFRKQAQLRLVLAWNGKEWKIVDLSPRAFFS